MDLSESIVIAHIGAQVRLKLGGLSEVVDNKRSKFNHESSFEICRRRRVISSLHDSRRVYLSAL